MLKFIRQAFNNAHNRQVESQIFLEEMGYAPAMGICPHSDIEHGQRILALEAKLK